MCEHERLRTVGDDVFCCICGEKLPLEFLMNKGKPEEPVPAEPDNVQTEPAEEPVNPEEKPKKKAPAKKTKKTEDK